MQLYCFFIFPAEEIIINLNQERDKERIRAQNKKMSTESREIGDNTNMIDDAESRNESRFDIFLNFDSSDRFERIDREIRAMQNYVEQLECESVFCKLGFEHKEKEKIDDVTKTNQYVRRPKLPYRRRANLPSSHSPQPNHKGCTTNYSDSQSNFGRASDLLLSVSVHSNTNKVKIANLSVGAMEELVKMCEEGPPLWLLDLDGKTEILNMVEYNRQFRGLDSTLNEILRMIKVHKEPLRLPIHELDDNAFLQENRNDLHTEASRETCIVPMNAINLVQIFMDAKKWSDMFYNVVSRAMVLGNLSTGVEGNLFDGALQVMTAEFHIPTPLVQVRECHFARYCKQLAITKWGIVDISLESVYNNPLVRYRRRPSGCLIEELPNGHSKVIWVEHVEANTRMLHNTFQALIGSGFAFSAKRWVATLVRQFERCATSDPGMSRPGGRENLYRLSERMMKGFCDSVNASNENVWMPIPVNGFEDVRIMTNNILNQHVKITGTVVTVATSVWIPSPMRKVFNFLRNVDNRYKWDLLLRRQKIEEVVQMNTGSDIGNWVSILRVCASPNKIAVLYLQESCYDTTGAYVTYAPIDIRSMDAVLNGGDPDYMVILPSGFAILPYMRAAHGEEIGGTILTVAFQMLDSESTEDYLPSNSVGTVCNIVKMTVDSIKNAVGSSPNHP